MSDEEEPVIVPSGKALHYGSLEATERARQSGETSGQDVLAEAKDSGNINISDGLCPSYFAFILSNSFFFFIPDVTMCIEGQH